MTEVSTTETGAKPASDLDKINSLFNEEIYVRMDVSSIPASKFKIYDDLLDFYKSKNLIPEVESRIKEHVKEHPESISGKYMLLMISLEKGFDETQIPVLREILEAFKQHSKWGIIEYITDNVLKFQSRDKLALRYKAEALEKLKKNKELKAVLEILTSIDSKNPDLLKKYALSILEEDKPRAIKFLKEAVDVFTKNRDYAQVEDVWNTIISHNYDDQLFFEKIEKNLLTNKEKTRLVTYLQPLVEPFRQLEEWDKVIYYLKKILDHEPNSPKFRNELIRTYKQKYESHSLFEEFLGMSELGNFKRPVKECISSFERNIVFDTGNYVLHRNWGVGKIVSISPSGDSIFVDFKEKKNHKLSIQMAITSLRPLQKDNIWVKNFEDGAFVKDLFKNNLPEFITEVLRSHGNAITASEMKNELVPEFVKLEDWSKFWTKVRDISKKNIYMSMNPKKKDELQLHEKSVTFSQQLIAKFEATGDPLKKLDIAMEVFKDVENAPDAIERITRFYNDEEVNPTKDVFRKLVAYLYLEEVASKTKGMVILETSPTERVLVRKSDAEGMQGRAEDLVVRRNLDRNEIEPLVKAMSVDDVKKISQSILNVDLKKGLVQLVKAYHPNYVNILVALLFEIPIKNNKYIFSLLEKEGKTNELVLFVETVFQKAKEHAEVFLWVAKSLLQGQWQFEWLPTNRSELSLKVFRILKPLSKLEEKGARLKNIAKDLLFENNNEIVLEVLKERDEEYARKVYALYKEVPYISDIDKDNFQDLIKSIKPNIVWDESLEDEDDDEFYIPEDVILVTRMAYNQKKAEFDHLVNVEMAENSRDIGEAQEKGDLRENAEYKAAMEKQVQLQAQIKKLEAELKSAKIIDLANVKTDRVDIGSTVTLKNENSGEQVTYSILGAWDANTEKNIISYISPLGKSLLGKRLGDTAILLFGGDETKYTIENISRFNLSGAEV